MSSRCNTTGVDDRRWAFDSVPGGDGGAEGGGVRARLAYADMGGGLLPP